MKTCPALFGLVEIVRDVFEFTNKDSRKIVVNLLGIIKDTLVDGDDVIVSRFGKFYVKEKSKRRGRNPATGEDLMLGSYVLRVG